MIINIDKAYLLPTTGIYVKAEVSGEEYFSDITISRLNVYKGNETTPIATCELPEGTKAFAKLLDFTFFPSNILSSFNSNIYRVELIPDGTVGLDTPCGEDRTSVSKYVINDYAIYKASKVFGRDFCGNCNCSIPRKAINFILNYSLLRKAIDYNQYRLLNTWYRDFQLRYVRKIAGYKVSRCGCNSVNIDDIFNAPIEPKMPKCGCGGDSSLEGLVSYYDTLCGNGTISLDKTFCNLVAELFYILDRLGADIETVTKSATGGSYDFIVGPTGDGGGSTPVDPDDPDTPIVPVESITLNRNAITVPVGTTFTLTPIILPYNATDKGVTWTSDNPEIAAVTTTGQVVGVRVGETRVIATCCSQVAMCNVTVTPVTIDVDSIAITPNPLSIYVGDSVVLTATVTPSDATDPTVTWISTDETVATVSPTGRVNGVNAGTAEIIATAGNKSATCVVTVSEHEVVPNRFDIRINPAPPVDNVHKLDANLSKENHTKQFDVFFYNVTGQLDRDDLIANAQTSWSSGNQNVFTVNNTGLVTAVGDGEAILTAISTYDGYSATATTRIRVTTSSDVTGIFIAPQIWTATLGVDLYQALTVTATYSDSSSGPISKHDNIDFTTSNANVAAVTEYGIVWAVGAGTATITATLKDDSSISDTITVIVTAPTPSVNNANIFIDCTKNPISVGERAVISVTVGPNDLADKSYTIASSDDSIATIDANNIITGVAAGTCTITASLNANPSVTTSIDIRVLNSNVSVSIDDKQNASAVLIEDHSRPISASLSNWGGVGFVKLGCSDPSVITLSEPTQSSETGISSCTMTAVSEGQCIIRAEYSEDSSIYDDMTITVVQDPQGDFIVTPRTIHIGNGSSSYSTVSVTSTSQNWTSDLYDDYDLDIIPAREVKTVVTSITSKNNVDTSVGRTSTTAYYSDMATNGGGLTQRPIASDKPVIVQEGDSNPNGADGSYHANIYIPLDGTVKVDLSAIIDPANATETIVWEKKLGDYGGDSSDITLTPDQNNDTICVITPNVANCELGSTQVDDPDHYGTYYTPTATMLSGKQVTRVYTTCGNATSKTNNKKIYVYVYDPSQGGAIVRP